VNTTPRKPVIYRIRCYAMPRTDAVKALRSLLKAMLRRHGLRVLSIQEGKPGASKS
jgi:hypothetical protein